MPAAVSAAISATTRRPAVRVTLLRDVPSYSLLASSTPTGGPFHSAVTVAQDGSIVRAAMQNTAGSVTGQVSVQRVTSPSTPSQWTTWTALGGPDKLRDGGIALGTVGGTISLFVCDGASDNVYLSTSTDNGATWSAFALAVTVGGTETVRGLALATGANTTSDPSYLFALVDDGTLSATAMTVRVAANTGAGWAATFTKPASSPTGPSSAGLAALRLAAGSFLVVPSLYALSLSSGGGLALGSYTWSHAGGAYTAGPVIVPNDDASIGVQVKWPALAIDNHGAYALSYVEQDTGGWSGVSYTRAVLATSQDAQHWSEGFDFPPIPLNGQSAAYCQPLLYTGGNAYLVDNTHVYQASTAVATLDVSAQLLRYTYTREAEKPSRLTLALDNSAGTLLSSPAFGLNSRVTLEEGYVDAAGTAWYVTTQDHLVVRRSVAQRAKPGVQPVNELQIEAEDLLCKLARAARHDWVYTGQTLAWLAAETCAKAQAGPATVPATAQFSTTIAVHRIKEGATWEAALGRLLGYFGAWYRATAQGGGVSIVELQPTDPSVWTYTTADLEAARWGAIGDRENHARVYGKPPAGVATLPVGEAWDWAHANQTWEHRYRRVVEQQIATPALAATRAGFELADQKRAASLHLIQVGHHPGLELYDVITVTDAPAGVAAQPYRIVGALTTYSAQAADFSLQLHLEGV